MLLLVIEYKTFHQKDLVSCRIFTAPPPPTLDAFVLPSALRVTLGASLAYSWRIIDNSQVNQGRSISCCDLCCWTCEVLHKEMPPCVFPFCVLGTWNVWLWSWIGIYWGGLWAELRCYDSISESQSSWSCWRTTLPCAAWGWLLILISTPDILVCSSHIVLNKEHRNAPLFFSLIVLYIAN